MIYGDTYFYVVYVCEISVVPTRARLEGPLSKRTRRRRSVVAVLPSSAATNASTSPARARLAEGVLRRRVRAGDEKRRGESAAGTRRAGPRDARAARAAFLFPTHATTHDTSSTERDLWRIRRAMRHERARERAHGEHPVRAAHAALAARSAHKPAPGYRTAATSGSLGVCPAFVAATPPAAGAVGAPRFRVSAVKPSARPRASDQGTPGGSAR